MHWMVVCSVYYLGCMVVNINALFAEWSITECDYFQTLLVWNPLFIFKSRCCDGHFPGFGKYIFPQLQTCTALVLSADCTESSCSSNMVIFKNFLVFNFPFFNLEQLFSFPWISIPTSFSMLYSILHYQLNAFEIPKMVYCNPDLSWLRSTMQSTFTFFPSLVLSRAFSYCKYKPFINSFQSYLFCYKC